MCSHLCIWYPVLTQAMGLLPVMLVIKCQIQYTYRLHRGYGLLPVMAVIKCQTQYPHRLRRMVYCQMNQSSNIEYSTHTGYGLPPVVPVIQYQTQCIKSIHIAHLDFMPSCTCVMCILSYVDTYVCNWPYALVIRGVPILLVQPLQTLNTQYTPGDYS